MQRIAIAATVCVFLAGVWMVGTSAFADDRDNDNNIAVLDNCDPADPAWAPTGGCTIKARLGDVPMSEFGALLFSPLGPGGVLIGHPSWRNEPSYLTIKARHDLRVTNKGGRGHTFTKVANFGGGFVAGLNGALAPAPECTPMTTIPLPPGGKQKIEGLAPGLHKFQCCIHPWMRGAIRVE